ncbi:uncharacterized protein LOC132978668 isoform X2 [Labrus mixtus]|uniref:uncharacterized protein LOC132978668 isoform X2 n=1 Tax=Labrus mixtus TaxID=508554 RepID=UPI0029C02940|nr:uncharacterized protein LOC132978668 isoform X2 [Labrus mixtus]
MAGRLLFVFFMYVFNGIQTEARLPPKLTVNPAVITETDSVTLNCQTPSSVSVSQCYYQTLSGGTVKILSCLQTLTGSELLKMDHQSSPAEVKVKCFYTVQIGGRNAPSPHSDTVSISIQTLPQPDLMVNPAVITETDSVTLNCQTPSSVSVSQCYYQTLSGGTVKIFSCLQTLTGSELLKMDHQSSSAEVKVKCFYTVQNGDINLQSPHSDTVSISIQTLPQPDLMVNPAVITETDSVTLNCQTPSSVSVSQCYYQTLSGGTVKILSCLQTLTGSELLKMDHQSSPAEVKVKCFYTVQNGDINLQSPESEYSSVSVQSETNSNKESASTLTTSVSIVTSPADQGIVEKESRRNQRMPSLIKTTVTGSEGMERSESRKSNRSLYHIYSIIYEGQTAAASKDMIYSKLQAP